MAILAELQREHIAFEYIEGQEGPTITPPDGFSIERFWKLVELEEEYRPVLRLLLLENERDQEPLECSF